METRKTVQNARADEVLARNAVRRAERKLEDAKRETAAAEARETRIREAGDAYGANRDGSMFNVTGGERRSVPGPTRAAADVLAEVHASHLRGDGLSLSHVDASILWAEIMRRSHESGTPDGFRTELATNADARRGGRA